MKKMDVRLTVWVEHEGESIPALTLVVDPRCLAYTIARNETVDFEINHRRNEHGKRDCICGQPPAQLLKTQPWGVQIGDGNIQNNTFS